MAEYVLYPNLAVSPQTGLNEVLLKEDVQDLLSNLFPLDLQLHAWCDRIDMSQVLKESPIDTYGQGNAITRDATGYTGSAGLREEGIVPVDGAPQYPWKLRAVAELHAESFGVSGTDRASEQYGITDRYTLEALKFTRKVANDFEQNFWWGQGTAANGTVTDAGTGAAGASPIVGTNWKRATQGVVPWITRTGLSRTIGGVAQNVYNAHGEQLCASSAPTQLVGGRFMSYAYNAGNINLDRGMFANNLMQPWWDLGGETEGCVIFCSPKVKALFSTFALQANGAINERKIDAAERLVIDTVDAYETDFGIHYINKSRYLNIASTVSLKYCTASTQTTLTTAMDEVLVALMPSYWKIGVYRPVGFTPLAKTGDLDRGMITGELAMACMNLTGGAAVVNCVA